jgi:hypothetical protein
MGRARSARHRVYGQCELVTGMNQKEKQILAEARAVERDAADLLRRQGFPDAMTQWRNDAAARAEAKRKADRERRAEEREHQRKFVTKTVDPGVRVPDDLTVFVAPANWQNEVIASLRTAMGQGDAQVLNDVCDAVFPTLEKLRGAISEGDARVLNTVREAVFPTLEKIAAKLERDINAIGERVDRKLAEMQAEVRSAINKRRAGAVIDLPSPLSKARGLN